MSVVNVWARRALVVLGVVVLIFGGLFRGAFLVVAVVVAGVAFVAAGRAPEDDLRTANLLVLHGEVWTRDGAGRPNRWNPTAEVWEVVDPAPPNVIRAWDQESSEEEERRKPGRRAARVLLVVVLTLVGWAFADPHANIPFVSQVVCSLKGASWYEGSAALEVSPGCYDRAPART